MTAFNAVLDATPVSDAQVLKVIDDFFSLKSKVNAQLAYLSESENSSSQQPLTTHTDAPPLPPKMMTNLKPMGGGRSIRKKPGAATNSKGDQNNAASKALDEMLQAAAAQSQPPVQMNTNSQPAGLYVNCNQSPGIPGYNMPYNMPPVVNTWMDSNYAMSAMQYNMNPYSYAYNQQSAYQQQCSMLFQPPVEVVDLSDSEEEARKNASKAVLEPSISNIVNSQQDIVNEAAATQPISKEASEVTMIEELKKLGYNVSKTNESPEPPSGTFLSSEIKITNVTSVALPSPINFSNNDDPLDITDEPESNEIPFHFSPPESPISPPDRPSEKLPMLAIAAAKSRPPAPPSNLYSFMQHANNPAPARHTHHRHLPPTPSPQRTRTVSFSSDTSPNKSLDMDEHVPTYTSPLENIYEPVKHKISVQEYKQRQQSGSATYGSHNGARPKPPVDLMKQYFTDNNVSQSKPFNGFVNAQKKPSNGHVHSPVIKLLKTSKPVKMIAPLKGILKKHEGLLTPEKKPHTSSPKKSSKELVPFVSLEKKHIPDIFPIGLKTPLPVPKKSPVMKKSPEMIVRHDKEYYLKVNNEDKTRCTVCKGNYKHITKHFKEKHPEFEVLISRFSTTDLQLAEEELSLGVIPPFVGQFQCRLCPEKFNDLEVFKDHCTYHTGEYCYCCSECTFTFPYANDIKPHWQRLHNRIDSTAKLIQVDIFPKPSNPNVLYGYVCPVCHWLQLSKKNVETHILRNHGNDCLRTQRIKQVNMVMHLPDEEEVSNEPAVNKRGRKKKEINYRELALADVDEPKKKRKKRSNSSEIYMLSTSGEEAGLKLTFSKTKDPLEASSLLGKKTYEKHNDAEDNVPCAVCDEEYYTTTKTSDWLKCVKCNRWLHCDCTPYSEMCVRCGGLNRIF